MSRKFYSFLFSLDLIGAEPHLFIYKNNRYKTLFSSILSIIIIIFSIFFSIFSLSEYLKYENPTILYSKDNDISTKREIFLNNTLFMFQLVESSYSNVIDDSIAYYEADYFVLMDNGSMEYKSLEIEKCQLGKNVDLKFKSYFTDKYTFGRELKDFYCINSKNMNISLFYYPLFGASSINLYIIFKNNSKYIPEKIQSLIISGSDLIDHNNKDSPIKENYDYHLTTTYNSLGYTKINYNFQFIKYESDDGFFYKDSKISNGISFSDTTYMTTIQDDYSQYINSNKLNIGKITFSINKSNFDNYKRIYPRLQSLLADVMSVISLLFEIGRQIINILCKKKMSKDIVEDILTKNKKYFLNNTINSKNKIKLDKNNEKSSERNIIKTESFGKIIKPDFLDKSVENKLNISKDNKVSVNEENINNQGNKIEIEKIFNKINYCHIIKSFFCFKDKKTKLINLCHDIITEDICIERILERINNLEIIYQLVYDEDNENYKLINNRFNEIIQYISNKDNKNKITPFSKEEIFKNRK